MKPFSILFSACLSILFFWACTKAKPPSEPEETRLIVKVIAPEAAQTPRVCGDSGKAPTQIASAEIQPRAGAKLVGWAEFLSCDDGVHVEIRAARLKLRPRAVHIHTRGDCSDDEALNAGDLFIGDDTVKASTSSSTGALGNLGNLEPKDDISLGTNIVVPGATLDANKPTSFLGRAIVLYFKSATGSAPDSSRIGCGVIKEGALSVEQVRSILPMGSRELGFVPPNTGENEPSSEDPAAKAQKPVDAASPKPEP